MLVGLQANMLQLQQGQSLRCSLPGMQLELRSSYLIKIQDVGNTQKAGGRLCRHTYLTSFRHYRDSHLRTYQILIFTIAVFHFNMCLNCTYDSLGLCIKYWDTCFFVFMKMLAYVIEIGVFVVLRLVVFISVTTLFNTIPMASDCKAWSPIEINQTYELGFPASLFIVHSNSIIIQVP